MPNENKLPKTWTRLDLCDEFGVQFWSLPLKRLPVELPPHVHVRWPDGTESVETVARMELKEIVFDHGHETPVEFAIAILSVNHHGLNIEVYLDQVEVRSD